MSSKRPDRTSMPGMIYNANKVLDTALSQKDKNKKLANLLTGDLEGIVLMSVVEAGFIFSGNLGTGILMAKKEDGSWSAPSAIGLTGVGWGFILGASAKEVMIFIYDASTVKTMAGDAGLKFGGQLELTLGKLGRSGGANMHGSNKGVGATASIAFSKGIFGGISLEGAIVGPRSAVNESFYGKAASPNEILYENAVTLPEGTEMAAVYEKLEKLVSATEAEEKNEEQAAE